LVPLAAGATSEPTAGFEVEVVLAFKLRPNWLKPWTPAVDTFIAVIVFEPEVSVGPLTVIEYPLPALVDAAICDSVVAVSVGENSWLKAIAPLVAVEQSGTPLVVVTVPPVQKTKDSGIVPVKVICWAVLAVTEPVSVAPPVTFVEAKLEILTKKVQLLLAGEEPPQLVPLGLVIPSSL
jgi:hypothetical protein